jgi:tripartite-type tricarboxylate transporter receptor subunit TctC
LKGGVETAADDCCLIELGNTGCYLRDTNYCGVHYFEDEFGTSGVGSSGHLAGELFKAMAGINMVPINYKGAGAVLNDLIASQVQLTFATATSVTGHLKSGRLRALAVTSAQPSILFPGLLTVAASGLLGYESGSTSGIFAPAKTPEAITRRLNQEIVRVLNRADVKEKFFNSGSEVVASSPEQLAATIKSDLAGMGKVIKDAGIRVE